MFIHRPEIQTTKTDKEIIPRNHTGLKHVTKIQTKTIEAIHLSIKDNLTIYNQLNKLNQTLPVLITQKAES